MSEPRSLTHDELLLWLNDRIGCVVGISVSIGRDGRYEPVVLAVPGTLRHHTTISAPGADVAGRAADEVEGMYLIETGPPGAAVGYVTFDVSDLGGFQAITTGGDDVSIIIDHGVGLTIREHERD
jgi:hypothetical protein